MFHKLKTLSFRGTALFALLAIGAPSSGFGQGYDLGPAKQSLATLKQTADNIQSWTQLMSVPPPETVLAKQILLNFPLGSPSITLSCGTQYDTHRYPYPGLDLGGKETRIILGLLNKAEKDSKAFTYPMQHWLKTTVPAIGAQFDTVSRNILEVEGEMQRGPGNITAQREKVSSNLEQISSSLQQGNIELKGLTSQLALYLKNLQQINIDVGIHVDRAETAIKPDLAKLNHFLDAVKSCEKYGKMEMKWCGGRSQLTQGVDIPPCTTTSWATSRALSTELNRELNHYFVALKSTIKLTTIGGSTDTAGSVLLGTMVNMLNRFNLVSQRISKAQTASSLNSAMQELHIQLAAQAWQDFATYSAKQVP
jgi:hypothetical protein